MVRGIYWLHDSLWICDYFHFSRKGSERPGKATPKGYQRMLQRAGCIDMINYYSAVAGGSLSFD